MKASRQDRTDLKCYMWLTLVRRCWVRREGVLQLRHQQTEAAIQKTCWCWMAWPTYLFRATRAVLLLPSRLKPQWANLRQPVTDRGLMHATALIRGLHCGTLGIIGSGSVLALTTRTPDLINIHLLFRQAKGTKNTLEMEKHPCCIFMCKEKEKTSTLIGSI